MKMRPEDPSVPGVFPDTNALLAMLLFSRDHFGKPTLGGEVRELYEEQQFRLLLNHAVIAELKGVVSKRFPEHRQTVDLFLKPFEDDFHRWPDKEEVTDVQHLVADPPDAVILASALLIEPDIFVTNDFEPFHTPEAKTWLQESDIQVESLYGLLCVFGRRERKGS